MLHISFFFYVLWQHFKNPYIINLRGCSIVWEIAQFYWMSKNYLSDIFNAIMKDQSIAIEDPHNFEAGQDKRENDLILGR